MDILHDIEVSRLSAKKKLKVNYSFNTYIMYFLNIVNNDSVIKNPSYI